MTLHRNEQDNRLLQSLFIRVGISKLVQFPFKALITFWTRLINGNLTFLMCSSQLISFLFLSAQHYWP